jgi:hypothetical protein
MRNKFERGSVLPDVSWYNIPNRENLPNDQKCTKLLCNMPKGRLTYRKAIKYTNKFPFRGRPQYSYPFRDFWNANIPSGNPGVITQFR